MQLFRALVCFVALPLSLASTAWAQSIWNVTSGDWNTSGNWSPSGIPGSGTSVEIGTTSSNRTANITSANASSSTAYLGFNAGNIGTVIVTNGKTWTDSSELYIGEAGTGMLTIQSGGTVSDTNGIIGDASGTGTVTVTGSGSQWSSIGILHVGGHGTGTLNVQSGGQVNVTGDGTIGHGSDATGHATVDGAGSQWNITGQIRVGEAGGGTLSIQNGGEVSSTLGRVGAVSGGVGVVMVSGAGSLWTTGSGTLTVGDQSTGTLTLDTGGKVTAASVIMANTGSGQGTLNLNGTSASRGVLETTGLSKGSGSGATINFNGGILRATADSSDFLQSFGANDVQVQSGGAFLDTNGHNVTVNSTVQFNGGIDKQGAGTLTLSGDRNYSGSNTVESGTLANVSGNVGNGTTGSMTVTGGGSQWTNSVNLVVGLSGNGTLNIQSAGVVSSGFGNIALGSASSTGGVTVTGTGSQWTSAGDLNVGYDGNGTLSLQSGGTVSTGLGRVGRDNGAVGSVGVSGAGSLWSVSSSLTVGDSGTGTLTTDTGGKVTAGSVTLANAGSAKGTLNVNGTVGSRGVLETASITEGTGTQGGFINFNGGILRATSNQANFIQSFETGDVQILSGGAYVDTQSFTIGLGAVLQGAGGLTKQGPGKLTLSGASTYLGGTTVEAGTLEVTGSLTSAVTAQNGGTLSGTGAVQSVTLQSGAKISPGVSGIGTLHTLGETWNGGGTYLWDIGTATGTPGTNWDFIDATGALNIAATPGNKFTLDINGGVTGLTAFTTYQWTILTASAGFGGTFSADDFAFDTTDFTSNTPGTFSVATQGNNLVLVYDTPEPGSAALLLLGAGLLGARRRR
jgi:T5SS/PEP-CTERM-associated repeat protein/autotransporter-associated beta strand protein